MPAVTGYHLPRESLSYQLKLNGKRESLTACVQGDSPPSGPDVSRETSGEFTASLLPGQTICPQAPGPRQNGFEPRAARPDPVHQGSPYQLTADENT